ncbi:MAG: glycosyltransferase family 4 protein, partial [Desulfovibrionaceae bacterium]
DCDTHKAFAALPASKGRKWLYLQGFGDKRCNKNIKTGLAFAKKHDYRVLACSRYLMQEAERRGVAARLAAHGLDHETFHPPEGDAPRSPSVAMLTHGAPWKGTEDGLKALELVRKRRPDAEFWLFGGRPVLFKGNFLYNLPREKVARLLRGTAVYVCPSWFEGFGLPGLEALACGASLATTDTGGSREYAVHERTALVSSPRNPEALADNVLRLLEDETLRSQLAAAGVRLARERFKPWPEAAMDALSVLM